MKSNLLAIILGLFIVPSLAQTSVSTNQPYLDNQTQISQTSSSKQQDSPILSNDYKIAKESLDKAISEHDEATLRLGLKLATPSFQKEIIQAVKNAWFQSFVPDLIDILANNQNSNKAKTGEQQELKKTVVSALMHLTGLRFPNTEQLSKNDIQQIIEESQQWYRENEPEIQQALTDEMVERQQSTPILSKNYRVAKWALDKAVSEKDIATIRLGLKGFSFSIKQDAVLVIKQLDDKSFVPDLIEALDKNQGIIDGGSEVQSFQQELNITIISALKQLTDLKFSYSKGSPTSLTSLCLNNSKISFSCVVDRMPKDIEKILEECRKWWKVHRKENNF